jgi:citrate lyase alpha subunit
MNYPASINVEYQENFPQYGDVVVGCDEVGNPRKIGEVISLHNQDPKSGLFVVKVAVVPNIKIGGYKNLINPIGIVGVIARATHIENKWNAAEYFYTM